MDPVEIVGIIAGSLTTIAYFPQLIKVVKTKSTKDISLGMFILTCIGLILWWVYGYLINSISILIANSITFTLALVILIFKIRYR